MPDKPKISKDKFLAAIKGTFGIKSEIARKLGVDRHTIDRYVAVWPDAQQAMRNEVEMAGDLAESVILNSISKRDVGTAKWYARLKLADRGYAKRDEIVGVPDRPIEIIEIVRPYPRDETPAEFTPGILPPSKGEPSDDTEDTESVDDEDP